MVLANGVAGTNLMKWAHGLGSELSLIKIKDWANDLDWTKQIYWSYLG